jgi:ankyrin repeat protein
MGDQDVNSTLIEAVREGRFGEVREIISSLGLSNSQDWSEGYVLLCDAIKCRHTEVVKVLLTFGSEVNNKSKESTETPLHFAAKNGDIQIVDMLLKRGARINAKNYDGHTPLHIAITHNKMEITELLVNQGAAVNATNNDGITPLHQALETCSEDIINLLLSRVANVNARDGDGRTYIHIAAVRGILQIGNHLLKNGAYVDSAYTSYVQKGFTPLFLAVVNGHEKVVKLLLERGANIEAQDKDRKTVLHLAVQKGLEIFVKLLLEYGAKVDAEDKTGRTVLCSAVLKGHSVIIEHVLILQCVVMEQSMARSSKTCFGMVLLSLLRM